MSNQTPECDRLIEVQEDSQKLGEFYEWLQAKFHIVQKTPVSGQGRIHYLPPVESLEQMLADYFGIDLDEVDRERRAILAEMATRNDR